MIPKAPKRLFSLLVSIGICLLAGCSPNLAPAVEPIDQTAPPSVPEPVEEQPQPQVDSPQPVEEVAPATTYWVQPGVPLHVQNQIELALQDHGFTVVESPEQASVQVVLNPGPEAQLTSEWSYAVAAPFATVADGISWGAFQAYWGLGDASGLVGPYGFPETPTLVLTQDVADLLTNRIGPASDGLQLQIVPADSLTQAVWDAQPAVTVLPFDQLEPRLKVLTVDNVSVLNRDMELASYPLAISIGVAAQGEAGAQALQLLQAQGWQISNRNPEGITKVVMTGTVAVSRSVAMMVELNGPEFPSGDILPFFADADLIHTSNESSYAVDCPDPDWFGDPVFCSKRAYYDVLAQAGINIVEVTGNHVNDYGVAALENTLNVYDNEGVLYFGGGRNLEEATSPRIVTVENGTRIAFVGCNSVGPQGAFATSQTAGAAPCEDWSRFTATIEAINANDQADIVIAALQYWELPEYEPSAVQIEEFALVANAGADIVSGSHAHQPQGFAFPDGRFVHYGIGNLFFDQPNLENRQMFADKHVFYNGEHISTELFTGLIEDWSRPRPMDADERAEFLTLIFEASTW